jgi:hypothetical protein
MFFVNSGGMSLIDTAPKFGPIPIQLVDLDGSKLAQNVKRL